MDNANFLLNYDDLCKSSYFAATVFGEDCQWMWLVDRLKNYSSQYFKILDFKELKQRCQAFIADEMSKLLVKLDRHFFPFGFQLQPMALSANLWDTFNR